MMRRLFVPGWGAPAALYARGLAPRWDVLDPPRFGEARGQLGHYLDWLMAEVDSADSGVVLGGHSMGGALAVLAAIRRPEQVKRIVLLAPAGLPLAKPIGRSLADFGVQMALGRYPRREAARAVAAVGIAPRSALRLAREVRALDLRLQLERLRELEIPCSVVGCATDTLTPPALCRRIARLGGGRYRELDVPGGHMWMAGAPGLLARVVQ